MTAAMTQTTDISSNADAPWGLLKVTASKIQLESKRNNANLHRVVLLCNTLDANMVGLQPKSSEDDVSKPEQHAPPAYDAYDSPPEYERTQMLDDGTLKVAPLKTDEKTDLLETIFEEFKLPPSEDEDEEEYYDDDQWLRGVFSLS